jgi:calcineurin-like phosphoesterase family protein
MSRVWFTADLHLGHGNIIKYCLRPFLAPEERDRAKRDARRRWKVADETIQRHDDALLDAINAAVREEDTLWILGDFCWGRFEVARRYRERIRCRNVHLVWGNHDHRSIRPVFKEVLEQGMIDVDGQPIWLNHYPMRSWDRAFHGSWHLYGHVHGRLAAEDAAHPEFLTKDVGVDACDYRPWSFEELHAYMTPRIEKFNESKASLGSGVGANNGE